MNISGILSRDPSAIKNALNNTINDSFSQVIQNNSANCSQTNSQIQILDISKIRVKNGGLKISGISQEAIMAPNMNCSVSNTNESINKFKESYNNAASSPSSITSLLNDNNVNNKMNNLINKVANISQQDNLFSCIQNTVQQQYATITDIDIELPEYCKKGCMEGYICDTSKCAPVEISKIDQYIISKATAKCVNNNTQIQNAISEFANDIKGSDLDITLETIPEQKTSNISTIIIIVIVIILLTIIGGLIFYFRYNKKSGGSYNSSNYLFVRHVY
jgi:hypothetical protein